MSNDIRLYKYDLPTNLIANSAVEKRDNCRLMVLDRSGQSIEHRFFYELAQTLTPNDVLVLNRSRVFPARLYGKKPSGGQVELLLLRQLESDYWLCISKPGLKPGQEINFDRDVIGLVTEKDPENGQVKIKFNYGGADFFDKLESIGHIPIPPYITPDQPISVIKNQYQTVYAKEAGSAAAPTAGLHFTQDLLDKLTQKGVQIEYVLLHVGLGTFQPVRQDNLSSGKLHSEYFEIDTDTANRLNKAKKDGKRIIAVGTTSTRALESAVQFIDGQNYITKLNGDTQIFIYPPYQFKFVDSLITNFHLPESSLLMLVGSFVSQPNSQQIFNNFIDTLVGKAYREAIEKEYRFFSFGDAMWIK